MTKIVAKTLLGGVLAAGLAAAVPSSAVAGYAQLSGPAILIDAYNTMLSAMLPSASVLDGRFGGRPLSLDPYNAVLGAALVPAAGLALGDLYASYAFAPAFSGPPTWEGPAPFRR